ncbi:MAG: ATP-binding cassette domain-containing protein [Mycoplasma sp.]|nr:ATP-binding cassette domain-containing protein [Mycoplasma sp.]
MSIKVKDLTVTFGEKVAVNNVSLEFKENKITGLIGFNGSGKTTTFNALADFLVPKNGTILYNENKINWKTKKMISYLSAEKESKNQEVVISYLHHISNLYGYKWSDGKKKIYELTEKLEFTEFIKKQIRKLSKGNQQKIKIIVALLNPNIKYLFLDEPFDGLDPLMVKVIERMIFELKKEKKLTVIITSHRMDVVQEMCDEFYILKDGVLIKEKNSDDKSITILVNDDIDISKLKENKNVIEIFNNENKEYSIKIKGIEHFKEINDILSKDKKYVYSSLHKASISEEFYKGYKDGK